MAGELVPAIRRMASPTWGPSAFGRVVRRDNHSPAGPIARGISRIVLAPRMPWALSRVDRRGGMPPPWREYVQEISGKYRVEGAAGQYELYVGVDADPDFTAAPAQVSATLPFSYAVTPPGAGTKEYRLCLRYRNEYGLLSQNQYTRSYTIDDAGDLVVPDPSAPEDVSIAETDELEVVVTALYYPDADGDNRADVWDIYDRDDGTNPDPAIDVATEVAMAEVGHIERLAHGLGPYSFEADVRVIVRCRRDSDDADDGNSTVHQLDLSAQLAAPTHGHNIMGDAYTVPE